MQIQKLWQKHTYTLKRALTGDFSAAKGQYLSRLYLCERIFTTQSNSRISIHIIFAMEPLQQVLCHTMSIFSSPLQDVNSKQRVLTLGGYRGELAQ